jgi:hypothetical protein
MGGVIRRLHGAGKISQLHLTQPAARVAPKRPSGRGTLGRTQARSPLAHCSTDGCLRYFSLTTFLSIQACSCGLRFTC